MKRANGIARIVVAAAASTTALVAAWRHSAAATCQSACLAKYPNACYNLKPYHFAKDDEGVARVRVKNLGSFGTAFDWAVGEMDHPHNGKQYNLQLKSVSSGADVKVYDIQNLCLDQNLDFVSPGQGYCGYWGLTRTTWSGDRTISAKIWVAVDEMDHKVVKQQTILHELGHAVGLNHSCVTDDHTMWPCGMPNKDYSDTPFLKGCDAKGLIALYGAGAPTGGGSNNKLYDASFEHALGSDPWSGWVRARPDTAHVGRHANAAHSGDYGVRVDVQDESQYAGVSQAVLAEPGVSYAASAFVRHRSGDARQCMTLVFFNWGNGAAITLKRVDVHPGSSDSWHSIGTTTSAPSGTQAVGVYLFNCEAGTSAYDWDNVKLGPL